MPGRWTARLLIGCAGCLFCLFSSLAPAALSAPDARLQGTFAMTGRLVRARHVLGEHRGQIVRRAWGFMPGCNAGACPAVTLLRQRQTGAVDRLRLRRAAAGAYWGRGRFYVPLRCGGVTRPRGGLVVYRLRVQVVSATVVGGERLATAISGRYTSVRRLNLTRCPGGIGLDEATYAGLRNPAAPLPAPGPAPAPLPGGPPAPAASAAGA